MRPRHFALASMAAFLFHAHPAAAQTIACQPLSDLEQVLAAYGEKRLGQGVTVNGAIVALYVAPSGSWTLVVIRPAPGSSPRACPYAAGEGWDAARAGPDA